MKIVAAVILINHYISPSHNIAVVVVHHDMKFFAAKKKKRKIIYFQINSCVFKITVTSFLKYNSLFLISQPLHCNIFQIAVFLILRHYDATVCHEIGNNCYIIITIIILIQFSNLGLIIRSWVQDVAPTKKGRICVMLEFCFCGFPFLQYHERGVEGRVCLCDEMILHFVDFLFLVRKESYILTHKKQNPLYQ